MSLNFLRYKKIYFVFIGILSLASIASLAVFGLKPGIDFTGGSILELEYKADRPSNQEIEEKLAGLDLGSLVLQPAGERGVIIRMKDIAEEAHQEIIQKLGKNDFEEKRFEAVGSVIGMELKQKTITLILVSLFAVVFYIALAFRKVQRPVQSWEYALASLVSLFHDILIPLGVFSVLGKFYGVEISIPVVTALLTVGGSSINNVIVVFDRIRENIMKRSGVTFEDTVNKSINETLGRCLNTSFCYLLPLLAIFFFGGITLKYFALALIVGISAGTYSSVFLAGPLLTIFRRYA
ncbi:MAG: protein translocase subunit SecF [Candidatus Nealsonbacteria bacterium]|nr:protein translocase subunit SecF [Candidatus Nealsonbacteria bacterium]